MKKIPILLSTIILSTSTVGTTLPNIQVNPDVEKHINLDVDPITRRNLAIHEMKASQIFGENDISSSFKFLSIDYIQNQMGIQIYNNGTPIRRVIVVYRDYENGVTETEADQHLADLGEGNSEKWEVLWDYDAKGVTNLYKYVTPMDGRTMIPLKNNLTDVIYYAVEYGEQDNTWWERGKISYRSCTRSSVFDSKTMICMQEGDGSYSVRLAANYNRVDMPGELIISWDEEWNEIQRQRSESIRRKLIELRDNLYNTIKILDGADKTLAGLAVTLPKSEKMDDVESLKSENLYLQSLSKEIREYYLGLKGTVNQDEFERLRNENEELVIKRNVLLNENDKLSAENEELRTKLAVLEESVESNMDLEKVNEAEDATREIEETVKVGRSEEVVERLEAKAEERIVAAGQDENARGSELESEADVEVPGLGELEDTRMNLWWIVAIVVGVVAVMITLVARFLRRSKHN